MLSFPLQSFVGWKVAVTILHVVTFACTGFRIFHRFKIQRMWFDDYLAILPMLLQIPYLVGFFFRYARYRPPADFKTDQQLRDVTSFGMTVFPCLTIIWAARTMLALSLARLFPPQHRIRRFALGLAVACVLAGISVQVVMLATCDNGAALIKGPSALACKRAGRSTVKDVYLWITDVLSDLFLIGTPLIVFRRIKLARDQRRLLFVVFSGSIATLAISIVFGVISFAKISLGRDGSLLIAGLCHIEATFSLFVANFGVLLTCAYRGVQRARQARAGGAGSAPAEGAAAAGSANNEKTTTAEAPPTTEHRRFHSDGCPCTTDWWASKDGEYPSTLNQTNWSNRNSTDEGKESDEEEGKGTKASK